MFSRSAGFSSIAVAFLSSSGFLISHLTWASVTCELFILSLPEDHHHLMLCELTALASEAETDVNFHNRCMSFRVKLMDLQAWSGASETGDNVAGLPNCPSRQLVFYTVIWVCSLPNCPWPGWNIKSHETLCMFTDWFFFWKIISFKGKSALCWIISAFAQTLLFTKLFLTKLPASG